MPAAEQQLGQQEVDEDHGGDAAWLAHQCDADHQQEHVRQVMQLQQLCAGDHVEDRLEELVADDVVVDLEHDAQRGDDKDVLSRPASPALRPKRCPQDDGETDDADCAGTPEVEGVPGERQLDRRICQQGGAHLMPPRHKRTAGIC